MAKKRAFTMTPHRFEVLKLLRGRSLSGDDLAELIWPGKTWAQNAHGGPWPGCTAVNWLLGQMRKNAGWVDKAQSGEWYLTAAGHRAVDEYEAGYYTNGPGARKKGAANAVAQEGQADRPAVV